MYNPTSFDNGTILCCIDDLVDNSNVEGHWMTQCYIMMTILHTYVCLACLCLSSRVAPPAMQLVFGAQVDERWTCDWWGILQHRHPIPTASLSMCNGHTWVMPCRKWAKSVHFMFKRMYNHQYDTWYVQVLWLWARLAFHFNSSNAGTESKWLNFRPSIHGSSICWSLKASGVLSAYRGAHTGSKPVLCHNICF